MKTDNSRLIRADTIKADPIRFQFRQTKGPRGVCGRLSGVTEWRPEYCGVCLVWEDFDGQLFVVDGHHRRDLALKIMRNTGKPIWLRCMVYRWDKVDAREAARLGAMKNVAEGQAGAMEIARLLRNSLEPADLRGRVPTRSAAYQDGTALATLEDSAWSVVLGSDIDPAHAAEVARAFPGDAARQYAAISYLARNPAGSRSAARNFAEQVKGATFEASDNLFGDDGAFAELERRAAIVTAAQSRLRNARSAFGNAVRNADKLVKVGNTLTTETNTDMHKLAAWLANELPRLAAFPGPTSNALGVAVDLVGRGTPITDAVDLFIEELFGLAA